METITVERTIPAPVESVYDWCADTTHWQSSSWVLRNRLKQAGEPDRWGAGAVRSHLWSIGWFLEEVTAAERPRSMDYLVTKSFPPSRHGGGSMTFTEVPGGTRVTWVTEAEMRTPVARDFATRTIVKPLTRLVFGRILQQCERDLISASQR